MEDIQIQFLKNIRQGLPKGTSLAFDMAELLDISTDSAYRRIRGETPLSLSEALLIARHYQVPLYSVGNDTMGQVTFTYYNLENTVESFRGYLENFLGNMRAIAARTGASIQYSSQDIPIFHNIRYGYLAVFKLFYWMKSILNVEEFSRSQFNPDHVPQAMLDISGDIYNSYCSTQSIEIWTSSTISSTIRQILFYWESGLFESREDAHQVCNDLREVMRRLQKQAENGTKVIDRLATEEEKNNFKLYVSEIELTNNCAHVELGDTEGVFLGHHTFNMLQTFHPTYGRQTAEWFRSMIGKSTLISSVGEKYRYKFFNNAFRQIDDLCERIEHTEV